MKHDKGGKLILCAIAILLAAASVTIVLTSPADTSIADDATVKVDGVTYEIDEKGYAIVTDADDGRSITIQSTVSKDGTAYPVKEIASRALSRCVSMTSISLPDTIVSIDYRAFMSCRSLTSISIPASTEYISSEAFNGCNSLVSITVAEKNTKYMSKDDVLFELDSRTPVTLMKYPAGKTDETYEIPNTVKTIGTMAFSLNHNIRQVSMSSVSAIGDRAFEGCLNLEQIKLSYKTASIGNMAFLLCKSLETIDLPANVYTVSDIAFNGCTNLMAINVDADNEYLCSVDGILFNKEKTTLIKYPSNKTDVSEYTIPSTVKKLSVNAFLQNKALRTIHIPATMNNISFTSFCGCMSLEAIKVSADNSSYCDIDGVLFNKDKTEIVRFPIAKNCNEYTIPDTVTTIGSHSFFGCKNIGDLHIQKNVQFIRALAFYQSSVKTITVDPDNGSFCAVDGVLYNKDMSMLCFYPTGKTDTSFTIPDSVVRFGTLSDSLAAACGLSDNTYLENIVINSNENYKSVDGLVYSKDGSTLLICPSGKTDVRIASGTETVSAGTFINSLMEHLTIPDNVTVSTGALLNCTSLETITVEGNNVVFDYLSVDFADVTGNYRIKVDAPNGYTIPATAYTPNVTFDYSVPSEPSSNDTSVMIVVAVIILVAIAAAIILIYRHNA